MTATSHSTYHALQTSLSGTMAHGGPGIQASYTWSKSIDDTSQVSADGIARERCKGFPQNPFNTHAEKGPSTFDVTNAFGLSVAQDLHLDSVELAAPRVSRKVTGGWELLSISSISSGSPFTVFSGIQQTGAGSIGVDRPNQIATPHLSTARAKPRRLLWRGRQQRRGFLLDPDPCCRRHGPEPGRLRHLGAQHLSRAGLTTTTTSP